MTNDASKADLTALEWSDLVDSVPVCGVVSTPPQTKRKRYDHDSSGSITSSGKQSEHLRHIFRRLLESAGVMSSNCSSSGALSTTTGAQERIQMIREELETCAGRVEHALPGLSACLAETQNGEELKYYERKEVDAAGFVDKGCTSCIFARFCLRHPNDRDTHSVLRDVRRCPGRVAFQVLTAKGVVGRPWEEVYAGVRAFANAVSRLAAASADDWDSPCLSLSGAHSGCEVQRIYCAPLLGIRLRTLSLSLASAKWRYDKPTFDRDPVLYLLSRIPSSVQELTVVLPNHPGHVPSACTALSAGLTRNRNALRAVQLLGCQLMCDKSAMHSLWCLLRIASSACTRLGVSLLHELQLFSPIDPDYVPAGFYDAPWCDTGARVALTCHRWAQLPLPKWVAHPAVDELGVDACFFDDSVKNVSDSLESLKSLSVLNHLSFGWKSRGSFDLERFMVRVMPR